MAVMARDVLLLVDDAMLAHDPGPHHPERPDRLRAIVAALRGSPVDPARLPRGRRQMGRPAAGAP
jgi:acetoin utilization deacetylase AcuC-like enzyme